jgi:hypothetical protein
VTNRARRRPRIAVKKYGPYRGATLAAAEVPIVFFAGLGVLKLVYIDPPFDFEADFR